MLISLMIQQKQFTHHILISIQRVVSWRSIAEVSTSKSLITWIQFKVLILYFFREFKTPKDYFACRGRLINKNTVNEFKESDKKQLLNDECAQFHDLIMSGQCLEDPSLLSFFILLSYAVSCFYFQ